MSYPDRAIKAPTDLVGCVLWLDASDGASITKDGSNLVSQWNDKSGNANHATQGTGANQPTYSATAFGGYPCLDWGNGAVAARSMATPAITLGPHTTFTVLRGDASSQYAYVHATDSGNGSYLFCTTGHSSTIFRSGSLRTGRNISTTWLRDSVRKHVTVSFAGTNGSHQVWVNGAAPLAIDSASSDPGTSTVSGAIYLGNNQVPGNPLRGVIAELVVFNRALTDGERVAIERYLEKKWGLATIRQITAPTDIATCSVWLDASDTASITKDGSNNVSQWNDKSGNANHATATGTARPTYSTFGGNPIVSFNGTTNEMQFTSNIVDASTGSTLVVVGRKRAVPGGFNKNMIVTRSNAIYIETSVANWGGYTAGIKNTGEAPSTRVRIFTARRGPSNTNGAYMLRADGVWKGSFATGGDDSRATSWLSSTAGSQQSDVDILEVVVFLRPISDGELTAVERYLNAKWNLSIGLARTILSPLDLPSCTLWLDASDLSSITKDGSSLVSQWSDKSGLGNHVTQGTATNKPLYTASGIDFDGNDNYMSGPAISALVTAAEYTLFCVFIADAIDTTSAGATVYNNDGLFTDAAAFLGMQLRTSGGQPQAIAYNWDGNADSAAADIAIGQRTVIAQTHIAGRILIASGGVVQAQTPSGNTSNVTNALQLGRDNSSHYFDGKILEVIAFNRALADGERIQVERYLARKWSI